jgi:hypothetical protein
LLNISRRKNFGRGDPTYEIDVNMSDITEKERDEGTYSDPTDDSAYSLPAKDFEPISTAASKAVNRSNSHTRNRPVSLRSLSRARSNNGYGCDDTRNSSQEEIGDVEIGGQEKDPWEVRWDGGDNDPKNPRSMTMGRRWIIVIIVSASSLCV